MTCYQNSLQVIEYYSLGSIKQRQSYRENVMAFLYIVFVGRPDRDTNVLRFALPLR